MTPSCNATGKAGLQIPKRAIVEAIMMLLLLTVIILGNSILYLHTKRCVVNVKDQASAKLWRALSLVGAVGGIIQLSGHVATKLSGGWFLGDSLCQVYGLFTCTVVSWWIWLLVCISFEKYFRKFHHHDHPTLFSQNNLWIMVWGTGLVVCAVYMGPTYGWAEYSPYWGAMNMEISLEPNMSSILSKKDLQTTYKLLSTFANPTDTVAQAGLKMFLSNYGEVHVRRGSTIGSTLYISIQFTLMDSASCYLKDFLNGTVKDGLQHYLLVRQSYGVNLTSSVRLNIVIPEENMSTYVNVYLPYQVASTCQLDYTHVNSHVTSFLALHIITAEIIPYGIMAFLFIRYASLQPSRNSGVRRRMSLIERVECYTALATGSAIKPLAYTVVFTLMSYNTFIVVSVVAGYGVAMPIIVLTLSYFFHYGIYIVPYVTFVIHTKTLLLGLFGEDGSENHPITDCSLTDRDDYLIEMPYVKEKPEQPRYERRRSTKLSLRNKLLSMYMTQKRYSYQRATNESII